jgi:ACS family tartrate transporter-like MFS transporter
LVNAIGNVGGFVGPNVIGFLRTATGGDMGAFLCLAAMALVAAGICVGMRGSLSVAAGPRPSVGVVGEAAINSLPMP